MATPKPALQPVVTPRAFEQVCAQIRGLLASGALKPGDKLPPERELAETLHVSRGVVREALRTLEITGLVQLRKGGSGGAFVVAGQFRMLTQAFQDMVHLGNVSLAQLTEARRHFVIDAIELACERATEAELDAIEDNIDRTEAAYRQSQTDFGYEGERSRLAAEFYHLIGVATKNEVITVTVDALTSMLLQFFRPTPVRPPLQLIQSRRRTLKHLRARDAAKASREMTAFFSAVQYYMLERESIAALHDANPPAAPRPARRRKAT